MRNNVRHFPPCHDELKMGTMANSSFPPLSRRSIRTCTKQGSVKDNS